MGSTVDTTDVVICGCGPTGAMLSARLGRLGVKNVILEKTTEITVDPRGIALDEDGIRALQSVGIYDCIYTEIGQCMGRFKFISGRRSDLHAAPFLEFDYATSEGGTGHVGFICHEQPILEAKLRDAIESNEHSELRPGATVTSIREDEEWVYADYTIHNGETRAIRARYLVGTDGKTGYTRKWHLEPKGIKMETATQNPYEETWIALNWELSLPTPSSHPNFPAWRLGHTPAQVYEDYFPRDFRFLCNPDRPAVCGRFGRPERRLWRFEFVVHPGEDADSMIAGQVLNEIVQPYFTRPGSHYGVDFDVPYPEDCIKTLRAKPFRFAARSCNKWAVGRVLLSGDSAHVFPPFGGQGIASGFRDACSLAWRLKISTQCQIRHRDSFFAGWYRERKQQLDRSLAATVENGTFVTAGGAFQSFLREVYFSAIQLIPSWRRELEKGARRHGMVQYTFEKGMHFLPDFNGGRLLPQAYCRTYDIRSGSQCITLTDNIVYSPGKGGVVQILAMVENLRDAEKAHAELASLNLEDSGYVVPSEATLVVRKGGAEPMPARTQAFHAGDLISPKIVCLASAAEFAASPLCHGRPEPRYYQEERIFAEVGYSRFVLVRPDMFTIALCTDLSGLQLAIGHLGPMFR